MLFIRTVKIFIILLFSMILSSCAFFIPMYEIEIDNFTPDLGDYTLIPSKNEYYVGEEVVIEVTGTGSAEFCGWFDQELSVVDDHTARIIVKEVNSFFISFSDKEIDFYESYNRSSRDVVNLLSADLMQTGLVEPAEYEFNSIPIAPAAEHVLKSVDDKDKALILPDNYFPRPLSQGQQGSCVAWAVGFAAKSYFEKKKQDWNLGYQDCSLSYAHNFEHIFSPAFIYNQLNNGTDDGIAIVSALELLETDGICTWAMMPYDATDYYTQPSQVALSEAANYKIENFFRINQTYGDFTSSEIQNIKNYLDSETPVIVSVTTDSNMLYPESLNTIGEYVWDEKGIESDGHAMCIVGYSDAWGFKVMNSWGPFWGNNGFIWIDISFFQNEVGNAAYIIEDY